MVNMSLSICTQLLDWNFGLREALPTWLDFPCDEIIIFDFGFGKEKALDVVSLYPDPRIKLFTPKQKITFNTSVGRNLAMSKSSSNWIFYIDSDVKILKKIDLKSLTPNCFMQGCRYCGTGAKNTDEYMDQLYEKRPMYNISLPDMTKQGRD